MCGCPTSLSSGCPKSGELLSLHYIQKMPDPVRRVVSRINKTRKGENGSNWKPSAESCICNMHYEDFKGPTRSNTALYPEYFKRPHHGLWSVVPPPPKRRLLQRDTPSDDGQVSDDDNLSQDDFRDS